MQEQEVQELISRTKRVLYKMDENIALYRSELREGRFRPRYGEKWERTVEKQLVEIALLELQHLAEQESLEEMCKLVDVIDEFAEKAKVIDA